MFYLSFNKLSGDIFNITFEQVLLWDYDIIIVFIIKLTQYYLLLKMVVCLDKIDELYYQGHLKKVEPSALKSTLSIKEAKLWLKEAEETYESGFYRSSRVATYFACLHAARSVTLRDGVIMENPQFLIDYLKKYCAEGNLGKECIDVLSVIFNFHYQDQHHFQSTRSSDDLKQAIEFGHEFINCMKVLLGKTAKLPRAVVKNSLRENEFVK